MILKIRTVDPDAIEAWRFFDGVEGLHYSIFNGKDEDVLKPHVVTEGVQEVYFKEEKAGVVTGWAFMSFQSDSTGPMHIYSNTTVYLLNDNGKTIQRLI